MASASSAQDEPTLNASTSKAWEGRAYADRFGQIVVYLFTLNQEREARQGIGILSTDEGADATDIGRLRAQIRPV